MNQALTIVTALLLTLAPVLDPDTTTSLMR